MPRIRTALGALLLATLATTSARAASRVTARPVAFTVQNINRSVLDCGAAGGSVDGEQYTIRGHLVGTAAELRHPTGATLYLHGLGLGEFFWRFTAVPGYDYASDMARAGHVSVTIDRLGYGTSDKPVGGSSCIGGQADIAHQILQQLRSGSYTGATSPAFRRVGLVGHSAGGLIAELEAASFHDPSALGVLAYGDQGTSLFADKAGDEALSICQRGGVSQSADGTGPGGYALLGQTPAAGRRAFFSSSANPRVVRATMPLLTRNPCGDLMSYSTAPYLDGNPLLGVGEPLQLVQGGRDALFPPPAVIHQADTLGGARSVRTTVLAGSGHALTLDVDHRGLERTMSSFLTGHGL